MAHRPNTRRSLGVCLHRRRNRDHRRGFSPRHASLPVESLRLDETILETCITSACIMSAMCWRCRASNCRRDSGRCLLKRLDQLTGDLAEPLTKLVSDPPVAARMEFDAPVEALEDIWRIFEKLLGLVVADLTRRNHGVRQLRLIFKPDRGWGLPTIARTIALTRPHRDRATLLNLIRCETERVDCEHGFVRFQLDVPLHEPIAEAQTQLFDQQAVEEEMELDRLLAAAARQAGRGGGDPATTGRVVSPRARLETGGG